MRTSDYQIQRNQENIIRLELNKLEAHILSQLGTTEFDDDMLDCIDKIRHLCINPVSHSEELAELAQKMAKGEPPGMS